MARQGSQALKRGASVCLPEQHASSRCPRLSFRSCACLGVGSAASDSFSIHGYSTHSLSIVLLHRELGLVVQTINNSIIDVACGRSFCVLLYMCSSGGRRATIIQSMEKRREKNTVVGKKSHQQMRWQRKGKQSRRRRDVFNQLCGVRIRLVIYPSTLRLESVHVHHLTFPVWVANRRVAFFFFLLAKRK